jgi:hypothetical protein
MLLVIGCCRIIFNGLQDVSWGFLTGISGRLVTLLACPCNSPPLGNEAKDMFIRWMNRLPETTLQSSSPGP